MDDKTIIIVDDNNHEQTMEIYFSYQHQETGFTYVFYFDPQVEDGPVYVSQYDDDGHLFPVEDEALWNHLNEVLQQYQLEEEDEGEN